MALLVDKIVEELSSIFIEEITQKVRLVVGVEKEVGKLTSNFRAIQAVLADAEERQSKEATIKHWLDQLKDISYKIEDVLDEWSTAILESKIEAEEHPPKLNKKVCFPTNFSCFGCCEVGLRHEIAHKIKKLNERLDAITKEKDLHNLKMETGSKQPERQITASVIDLLETKGREIEKQKLIDMLLGRDGQGTNPHHPQVISIVGMGGVGKTTLAQIAYNDDEVKSYFDKRIWVCVSEPFDEIRVARAILESILGSTPNLGELENLLQTIHQSIDRKKFLLILDDVWDDNSRKWEKFKNSLKSGLHESKILVTTRKENVARVIGSTNFFQLGQLSTEESWSLFSQAAFCGRTNTECERLEELGRRIVRKCKGLPLTLKTIGGMLRFRNHPVDWRTVLDSDLWDLEETEKYILPPLWLSYHDLSFEMRQCFSYCSLFPKDYVIEKDKLINLWIAQGYLSERGSKEIETIGEECFENLAARSFFQDFERDEEGNIVKCKMHDMVHDLAQFLMKKECVSVEINGPEEMRMDSSRGPRHLMVRLRNDAPFPLSLNLRKLRSLLVEPWMSFASAKFGADQANLYNELICLRALELSRLSFTELAFEVSKLMHLRHLDLTYCKKLKVLPEAICELYNLLLLDVRGCVSLEKLPLGIGKLTNLRHIKNSKTVQLTFMPKGIRKLCSLRTLNKLIVGGAGGDGEACSLGDLKALNELRNELEIRGLGDVRDVSDVEKAQLKNKKHLNTLTFLFDGTKAEGGKIYDNEVLEALQPPPTLECLKIERYRGTSVFTNWMMILKNLKKISLFSCINCNHLPPLGRLPSLEFLEIRSMPSLKKMGREFLGIESDGLTSEDKRKASSSLANTAFPKLKGLTFVDMEGLEELDHFGFEGQNGDGGVASKIAIMPCLLVLVIWSCPKLKAVSDQILQNLKELHIIDSPILQDQYKENRPGEDWQEIKTGHLDSFGYRRRNLEDKTLLAELNKIVDMAILEDVDMTILLDL